MSVCRKQGYEKKTAQSILNERKAKGKKWSREKRIYECPICFKWHLTSMEEYTPLELIDLIFKDEWEKLKA